MKYSIVRDNNNAIDRRVASHKGFTVIIEKAGHKEYFLTIEKKHFGGLFSHQDDLVAELTLTSLKEAKERAEAIIDKRRKIKMTERIYTHFDTVVYSYASLEEFERDEGD